VYFFGVVVSSTFAPYTKVTTLGKDLVGIIATKFGLILFSGSQEEIQNVKSLQRDAK
jgi:hypothetical protein